MNKQIIPTETLQKAVNALETLPYKDVAVLIGEILAVSKPYVDPDAKPVESAPSANTEASSPASSAPTSGPDTVTQAPAPKKRGRKPKPVVVEYDNNFE